MFAAIVAALKVLFAYPPTESSWTDQQRRDAEWWFDVAVKHGEEGAIHLMSAEAWKKKGK